MLLIYHLVVICDHDSREIQLVPPFGSNKPGQFLNECVHWVDKSYCSFSFNTTLCYYLTCNLNFSLYYNVF